MIRIEDFGDFSQSDSESGYAFSLQAGRCADALRRFAQLIQDGDISPQRVEMNQSAAVTDWQFQKLTFTFLERVHVPSK